MFLKHYITDGSMFFLVLCFRGLNNLISDGPSSLWWSFSQAGCWTWHREKKSWNFIKYWQRNLYWTILHCRLRGISMTLLTHVPSDWGTLDFIVLGIQAVYFSALKSSSKSPSTVLCTFSALKSSVSSASHPASRRYPLLPTRPAQFPHN